MKKGKKREIYFQLALKYHIAKDISMQFLKFQKELLKEIADYESLVWTHDKIKVEQNQSLKH